MTITEDLSELSTILRAMQEDFEQLHIPLEKVSSLQLQVNVGELDSSENVKRDFDLLTDFTTSQRWWRPYETSYVLW